MTNKHSTITQAEAQSQTQNNNLKNMVIINFVLSVHSIHPQDLLLRFFLLLYLYVSGSCTAAVLVVVALDHDCF